MVKRVSSSVNTYIIIVVKLHQDISKIMNRNNKNLSLHSNTIMYVVSHAKQSKVIP